jgi:hypothetical protein
MPRSLIAAAVAAVLALSAPLSAQVSIVALLPASTTAGGAGLIFSVVGTGFVSGNLVQWDGVNLPTTFVSSIQLNATLSAADVAVGGVHAVRVRITAGFPPFILPTFTNSLNFTVNNPVPNATAINPSSIATGTTNLSLLVVGSNFNASSGVSANGTPLAVTSQTATTLHAIVPTSMMTSPTTLSVTVTNPAPGGGTDAAGTINVVAPVPSLTSISPTTAPLGGGPLTLTVVGTNYVPSSVVAMGTVSGGFTTLATTFVSSTQLTAAVPASLLTVAGPLLVDVQSPGPGGGISGQLTFTVLNPAPTLASVTPNDLPVASPPTTLVLVGTGFLPTSVVKFNTVPLATTFVNPTTLQALLPTINSAEVNEMRVENPAPGGGLSAPQTLTTRNPAPNLTSIAPTAIPTGVGPTTVSIFGTGFFPGCNVSVNGLPVAETFVSPTHVTASINPGAALPGASLSVSVVNDTPNAGFSNSLPLAVVAPAPFLASVSPTELNADASPTTLTVTGAGLFSTTLALVDGVPVPLASATGSSLTLVVPSEFAQATGFRTVTIVNPPPGGGVAQFDVGVNGPVLLALFPTTIAPLGPGAAPVNVTLSGVFDHPATTEIRVDGRPATFAVLSATTASVQIDATTTFAGFPGGLAITAVSTVPTPGAKPVASNALALRIGTAASPDNRGTVSVLPRLAAPNEPFFVRVEAPAEEQPMTLIADFAQPAPQPLVFDPTFDLSVGVFFGLPVALADGLGLLGPPTGAALRSDNFTGFGVAPPRGVFDLRGFVAPAVPFGVTFTLQAVYLDPTQPYFFNATYPSRQTL